MTHIANILEAIESRAQWQQDPNPLYPMKLLDLFDVGSDHQTTMMCVHPGDSQHLHYHKAGGDIFLILHGHGTLITGQLGPNGYSMLGEVSQEVKSGDLYSIKPMEIHALRNTGTVDLVILNIAPTSHGTSDCIEV